MSGHAIHIKIDGRTYAGTYKVDRKILTVTTPYGRKSAETAPRVAHDVLAHQLLQGICRKLAFYLPILADPQWLAGVESTA